MHTHNLERLAEHMRLRGRTAALLSHPATITWLTGYAPPIETGPSPFEGTPGLAWWRAGEVHLILSDMEAGAAAAVGATAIHSYVSYTIDAPLAGATNQARALGDLLKEHARPDDRVGVEWAHLTTPLVDVVRQVCPSAKLDTIDGEMVDLRAVKAPEEIAKIRAALRLCDAAQAFIRQTLQPGKSELDLWAEVRAHVEGLAGTRLPILADLVAGRRTADIGGPPTSYRLQPGDPCILDFVPRLDGYWGDNAATHFAGTPSAEMEKAYAVVRQTLRLAVETARPGVIARELDAKMRQAIRQAGFEPHPHHSGHGFGTTYHDEPRIVPYSDRPLEPGMIVALEPGIYLPEVGGVRLEDVVLITADGNQLLTEHLL